MTVPRFLEAAAGPVVTTGGGVALWQALAQQMPNGTGGGNEVLSVGLLIGAIAAMAGAIGLLYREGRKATDAASANLNAAHLAQIQSIELLHRDLLKAKDETIAAKDQTIHTLEERCGVLDSRVVASGKEYQEAVHQFTETSNQVIQHLEELTQAVTAANVQSVAEHQEMIRVIRGEPAPPPTPMRRRRRSVAEG